MPDLPRPGAQGDAADDAAIRQDPELEAALRKVLDVIYKQHPLGSNQILILASELQRMGVHRLVEEHLRQYRRRS